MSPKNLEVYVVRRSVHEERERERENENAERRESRERERERETGGGGGGGVRIVFRQARESTHSIGENIKVMENKLPHSFRKRTLSLSTTCRLSLSLSWSCSHKLSASSFANLTDKNK